jgi:prepilin-type N-terminal cleavage/methylation domain-containing protein
MKNRTTKNGTEVSGCDVRRAEGLTQSSAPSPECCRGFTLVELLIVISIVAIMAKMLLNRVFVYQEVVEKAAMQQVVSAVQSALVMEYGHRMASGTGTGLSSISNENPMDWLARRPPNYAGEFNNVNPAVIEAGNWVFDKGRHELIYLPNHAEYFVPAKNGVRWIRFHTRPVYEPGFRGKGIKMLSGVAFSSVEPYQWTIKENE